MNVVVSNYGIRQVLLCCAALWLLLYAHLNCIAFAVKEQEKKTRDSFIHSFHNCTHNRIDVANLCCSVFNFASVSLFHSFGRVLRCGLKFCFVDLFYFVVFSIFQWNTFDHSPKKLRPHQYQ